MDPLDFQANYQDGFLNKQPQQSQQSFYQPNNMMMNDYSSQPQSFAPPIFPPMEPQQQNPSSFLPPPPTSNGFYVPQENSPSVLAPPPTFDQISPENLTTPPSTYPAPQMMSTPSVDQYGQNQMYPNPSSINQSVGQNQMYPNSPMMNQPVDYSASGMGMGFGQFPQQPQMPAQFPQEAAPRSAIPSPVSRDSIYQTKKYSTEKTSHQKIPSAASRYKVIDEGICSPRFMRPTLLKFPTTSQILAGSKLKMGVVLQPLAQVSVQDSPNFVPRASILPQKPIFTPQQKPADSGSDLGAAQTPNEKDSLNNQPEPTIPTIPTSPPNTQVPFVPTTPDPSQFYSGYGSPAPQMQQDSSSSASSYLSAASAYFPPMISTPTKTGPTTGGLPSPADEEQPLRCHRCKAYINPFVKFIANGKKYVCPLCGMVNDVPLWYEDTIDAFGVRRDIEQRPELKYGSVDWVATRHYVESEPLPMHYVFVLDVSQYGTSKGVAAAVTKSLGALFEEFLTSESKEFEKCKIAFITYGKSVQFFNLKKMIAKDAGIDLYGSSKSEKTKAFARIPEIMVLPDIEKVFLPAPAETLMVSFAEILEMTKVENKKKDQQETGVFPKLFAKIGKWIASHAISSTQNEPEAAMGAALETARLMLNGKGGKIMLFASQIPNEGAGKITPRDDYNLYGTDKENTLFKPQIGFYKNFAIACAKSSIGIDLFLFPFVGFMESSTLSILSSETGGNFYVYSKFTFPKDANRVYYDLRDNLHRETGYDAVLRVRVSRGFDIKQYFGNYHMSTIEDMDLANVDSDSTFFVEFTHYASSAPLKIESDFVYIQSALLYTSRSGERLIRVQTLKLSLVSSIENTLFNTDLEAHLCYLAQHYALQMTDGAQTTANVRKNIQQFGIDVLSSYRKHSSAASAANTAAAALGNDSQQLFIPDSLEYLILYVLGLQKSPALRRGTDIPLDERMEFIHLFKRAPLAKLIRFIYPNLFSLHNMPQPIIYETIKKFIPDLNSINNNNEMSALENQFSSLSMSQPQQQQQKGKIIEEKVARERYCLPPPLKLSTSSLIDKNGIYLLDDGITTFMLIGEAVEPDVLFAATGIKDPADVNAKLTSTGILLPQVVMAPEISENDEESTKKLEEFENNPPLGNRVSEILAELASFKMRNGDIKIFKKGENPACEQQLFMRLVEDRNGQENSYSEQVYVTHKLVKTAP